MTTHPSIKFAELQSTAFMMAAIAGFVDVIGFIGASKLFTAHITGNIVIAISEFIYHEPGVAAKLIALPVFILIVGITTWIIERHRQTKLLLSIWFIIEALLLAAFMFGGVYILPIHSLGSWQYISSAMLGVSAMAIHNTLLRTFMVVHPPCTVMTGNLTQFMIDFVSYYWRKTLPYQVESSLINHAGIKRFGGVFLGFLIGGTIAAFGFDTFGFWIVSLSIILLLILAVRTSTHR
jgi:uncharacterized membrane protein YoaK (UPF0700 family)